MNEKNTGKKRKNNEYVIKIIISYARTYVPL